MHSCPARIKIIIWQDATGDEFAVPGGLIIKHPHKAGSQDSNPQTTTFVDLTLVAQWHCPLSDLLPTTRLTVLILRLKSGATYP